MKGKNEYRTSLLIKLSFCFAVLAIFLLLGDYNKTFAAEQFCYLSDIPYNKEQSSVGWGNITLDQNLDTKYNQGLITLIVNGTPKKFLKGVSAHATSTLIYDISDLDYDYFSTYYGVDSSRGSTGNGVKFSISTSVDGEDWELHTLASPPIKKGNSEAEFIQINIKDKNYIKLYCFNNGNADGDHSVYANAKLYKAGYEETVDTAPYEFIKTLDEYNEIIRNSTEEELLGAKEKILLQRKFVSCFGYDMLQEYAHLDQSRKETVEWIMTDLDALRYYVTGGKPIGSYMSSLNVLWKLYKENKDDLNDTTQTEYTVLGDLYKRMMISLSLTHSANVGLWVGGNQLSDPLVRYDIYKKMRANNLLENKIFETLNIEEMRWVMNNNIDDEEIEWLNHHIRKFPTSSRPYNTDPYRYITYRFGYNYNLAEYYDEANYDKWDEKYDLAEYNITYKFGKPKLWIVFEQGSVCGGLSKTGSNINGSLGIPSAVIGQPGHAAYLEYSETADGKGMWSIKNDVGGWTVAEKGERMLAGWGSNNWDSYYQVSYTPYTQEALNDIDNYNKALEIMLLADLYQEDVEKLEEIYRKALEYQPINMDAWYGLISTYKRNTEKTAEDYMQLAKDLADEMYYFPLPMYDLLNLIKPKLDGTIYSATFTNYLKASLVKGTQLNAENSELLQPSISRTMANHLLGKNDFSIATFSFDGENANKIMLGSKYEGNGVRWEYNLNGGTEGNWIATSESSVLLTNTEINSITAEKDIKIHIVGVDYSEHNIYTIDIQEGVIPANIYANDLENRVVGVNLGTQWRYNENEEWTSYGTSSPDLTGDKTVQIRQSATGTRLASQASQLYTFTEDNQPDTRKYIPVSHLSIHGVSSQATGNNQNGNAIYAIDGNYNTRWHSAWNGSDSARYIIIKLDKKIALSAMDYVPAGGGNGKILNAQILGSTDGTEYTEITNVAWANNENVKTVEFEEKPEVQYIKIVGTRTSTAGGGNFIAARMFNFYQDLTKNPHPTAGIAYSTIEPTSGNVVARLINPSTKITITNNDGKDSYVFKENGKFTFIFEDEYGNEGSAEAKVDWIDKDIPTADVKYELDGNKKLVILLDGISEDVYLLDKNNNKINYVEVENGKISNISYLDSSNDTYKIVELDENGNTKKITYKNTTDSVTEVKTYITTLENGEVIREEYYDEAGNSVTNLTDAEKEELRKLQQTRSNPLEYVFQESGEYEFKLLDKASNLAYKSIKVDYIDHDTTILASDITYNITTTTNKNVEVTINPYIVDTNGKNTNVEIVNNDGNNKYTFIENGEFTFEYRDASKTEAIEIKTHTAKVNWIDKINPTAEIKYSTKEATSEAVIATLVNESEPITIINNDASREYVFTKNGEFTFEFEDKAGNKGTAKAKVDWIRKEEEKPDKYQLGDINKDGKITATDLLLLKRHLVAGEKQEWILTGDKFKAADINEDGKITATDLILIKRLVLEHMKQ